MCVLEHGTCRSIPEKGASSSTWKVCFHCEQLSKSVDGILHVVEKHLWKENEQLLTISLSKLLKFFALHWRQLIHNEMYRRRFPASHQVGQPVEVVHSRTNFTFKGCPSSFSPCSCWQFTVNCKHWMTRMSYAKQATVQLWSNFGLFSLGVKHYVLHAATENSRFSSCPSLHFSFFWPGVLFFFITLRALHYTSMLTVLCVVALTCTLVSGKACCPTLHANCRPFLLKQLFVLAHI